MTLVFDNTLFPDNYTKFNKIEDTDVEGDTRIDSILFLKLKAEIHNYSTSTISMDYFQYSKALVDVLREVYSVNVERFVPDYSYSFVNLNILYGLIQARMFLIMERLSLLDTRKRVYNVFANEFMEFMNVDVRIRGGSNLFMNIEGKGEHKILLDKKMNIMMITEDVTFIFMKDVAIMVPNNGKETEFVIITNDHLYMSMKEYVANFSVSSDKDSLYLDGKFVAPKKTQKLHIRYNYIDDQLKTNYMIYNNVTKLKLILSYTLEPNGDVAKYYNKNGLLISMNYTKETDTTRLISYCMVENSEEPQMRFRGKYEEERKGDKLVKKELSKNDQLIYQKEDDLVKIDTIHKKKVKEIDTVIGWKVAKSQNGENRIVKLMIPMDGRIVTPIDDEYFHTCGKERCDKAIVMDIQYPDKEEERSVVPDEMVAYSYMHVSNTPLEYKVGKEIYPDLFDTNEDTSCTHGIHFYRNRDSVFEVYANRR